jgi:hypothetical protein
VRACSVPSSGDGTGALQVVTKQFSPRYDLRIRGSSHAWLAYGKARAYDVCPLGLSYV